MITLNKAALWTDGRYFLQAEKQLNPDEWILMRDGDPIEPPPSKDKWLLDELASLDQPSVGIDATLISIPLFEAFKKFWDSKSTGGQKGNGVQWKLLRQNLVDLVWDDRPSPSTAPLLVHPTKYSGMTTADKLEKIRLYFDLAKLPSGYQPVGQETPIAIEAMVFQDLADIAWALNLRGSDIEFNPTFISYLVLRRDALSLYVDSTKITDVVAKALDACQVCLRPYEALFDDLALMASALPKGHVRAPFRHAEIGLFHLSFWFSLENPN